MTPGNSFLRVFVTPFVTAFVTLFGKVFCTIFIAFARSFFFQFLLLSSSAWAAQTTLTPEATIGTTFGTKTETTSERAQAELELLKKTGIAVLHSAQPYEAWQLQAAVQILTIGLGIHKPNKLNRLKYLYSQAPTRQFFPPKGFFSNELQAIILTTPKEASNNNNNNNNICEFYETLSHEIGHSVVFSLLSPSALRHLAIEFGPWAKHIGLQAPTNLQDPIFMTPHSDYNMPIEAVLIHNNVPSRYALSNVHEWFAETFSNWVIQTLAEQNITHCLQDDSISNALKQEFTNILNSN